MGGGTDQCQWAKIVVSLERSVKQNDAKQYLEEYSIKLPNVASNDDGDEPPQEVRGVMVIKSKSKTRARQRKGALGNWKVNYGDLIQSIHLELSSE